MFNEESKELKTFLPSENIFNSFIVDKRVYYTSVSGLFTIENGIELLVSKDQMLKNINQYPHILNVSKKVNNILIITYKL